MDTKVEIQCGNPVPKENNVVEESNRKIMVQLKVMRYG
jgi:hypothetical protein